MPLRIVLRQLFSKRDNLPMLLFLGTVWSFVHWQWLKISLAPPMFSGELFGIVPLILIVTSCTLLTVITVNLKAYAQTHDALILHTLGFTRFQLVRQILFQNLGTVFAAWLLGACCGYGIACATGVIDVNSPPTVKWLAELLWSFALAVGGTLLGSLKNVWIVSRCNQDNTRLFRFHRWQRRTTILCAVFGFGLLSAPPLLLLLFPQTTSTLSPNSSAALMAILFFVGILLLLPLAIVLLQGLLSRILGCLFHISPHLLANLLSARLGHVTLILGMVTLALGIFCALHIWSASLLVLFRVPDTIPNTLVRFHSSVSGPQAEISVENCPALLSNTVMELAVAQPKLTGKTAQRLTQRGAMADNTIVLGLNTTDDTPLNQLQFIEGNPTMVHHAWQHKDSPTCVIPETMSRNADLHCGDSLELQTETHTLSLKIIGVVSFPWVWFSKCSGIRTETSRTAGVIFAPQALVVDSLDATKQTFFWMNTDPKTPYAILKNYFIDAAQFSLGYKQEENPNVIIRSEFCGGTRWDSGLNKNLVVVSRTDQMNDSIDTRTNTVVNLIADMATTGMLLAMLVMTGGTILSVKERQNDFGLLRVFGISPNGIQRIVLAEAIAITLISTLLGVSSGIAYGTLANHLMDLLPMFGVIAPPTIIPWKHILPEIMLTAGISLLCGIIPTWILTHRETGALLKNDL